MINKPEDQLPFPACICCFHKACNIIPLHQIFQDLKLLFRLAADPVLIRIRKDRQIILFPFLILFIIVLRLCQLNQMPYAPTDKEVPSLQVAVLLFGCTDYLRNGLGNE